MPLILFLAITVFAQNSTPQWVEESYRSINHPASDWYVGFVEDMIKGQPSKKDFEAVEKKAQGRLSENIMVKHQSTSTVQTASRQTQKGEAINTSYDQNIKTESNVILAKVEAKSFFNKKTGQIYGFAAVKKKDLADFYRSRIAFLFSFAEKELSIAEQFAETAKIKMVEDSLKRVSFWGSMLQAVESDNSYSGQETELWKRLNSAKIRFQSGSGIFLNQEAAENAISSELAKILGQKVVLSKGACLLGITVAVESDKEPSCSDGMVGVICAANVQLAVAQCKDGKKTVLKGSVVGADKYSEEAAIRQVFRKMESADFWDEWVKELEKRSKPQNAPSVVLELTPQLSEGVLPPFTAKDRDANKNFQKRHLEKLAGQGTERVVLVYFATWCKPCAEGAVKLKRKKEMLARKGILVVLVNVGEKDVGVVHKWVDKYSDPSFLLVMDSKLQMVGPYGLLEADGSVALPKTLVLDKELKPLFLLGTEGDDFPDVLWRFGK